MKFQLSPTPINPEDLSLELQSNAAGGFVSFEGRVRDHNDGRCVSYLEYEAHAMLCHKEAEVIFAETKAKFQLIDCAVVHRTGRLNIGELAVWVGVSAAHRDAAFAACRYLIDEIKKRLPIWKKEFYQEGDSGWIGYVIASEAKQSQHQIASSQKPLLAMTNEYYSRQTILPSIGDHGQKHLANANVLVVGAGGLGSSALMSLAASGVGTIGVAEFDTLDISNLHRQYLYDAIDVGRNKIDLAVQRIKQLNPLINVIPHPVCVEQHNVNEVIAHYDYIVDCTDNFDTKFLLNDACYRANKILIQAGIYQFEGYIRTLLPNQKGCFRCLWPQTPSSDCVGRCTEVGVLGATVATIGHLQALETIKQILNLDGKLFGETLLVDLQTNTIKQIKNLTNPDCPVCGKGKTISPIENHLECGIKDLTDVGLDKYVFVDIREIDEVSANPVHEIPTLNHPSLSFFDKPIHFDSSKKYILFCGRGGRSLRLTERLHTEGITNVASLKGGVVSLKNSLKSGTRTDFNLKS